MNKKTLGAILTVLGVVVGIFTIYAINALRQEYALNRFLGRNDPNLSQHEMITFLAGAIAVVLLVAGLINLTASPSHDWTLEDSAGIEQDINSEREEIEESFHMYENDKHFRRFASRFDGSVEEAYEVFWAQNKDKYCPGCGQRKHSENITFCTNCDLDFEDSNA